MAINEWFGNYLYRLRLAEKLTLRQVEKKTGISNSYLSQIENGRRSIPTIPILIKLAKVYDVRLVDMIIAYENQLFIYKQIAKM